MMPLSLRRAVATTATSAVILALLLLPSAVTANGAGPFNTYAEDGYTPTTKVTDEAALDLDQHDFNLELSERRIKEGLVMYTQGGHSGSYAILSITNAPPSSEDTYLKGTEVIGRSSFNEVVRGTLRKDVTLDSQDEVNQIEVLYDIDGTQSNYVGCQVGGLSTLDRANREGCFALEGNITLGGGNTSNLTLAYSYNVRRENLNALTMQSLSTNAATSMMENGTFIDEFQTFVDYYGDTDYGDKWIMAAYDGADTDFTSSRGNSNFSMYNGRPARAEAMKKGAAYLNIWMEVVRQLNTAVSYCQRGDMATATNALDKAVVFYAGSLTVEDFNEGILLYALAEVRAFQMNTAGQFGNILNQATVNSEIFQLFRAFQQSLTNSTNSTSADRCDVADDSRTSIVYWMKVPLIQSVMYYAYIREKEFPGSTEEFERIQAEGATMTATLLPWLHACDSNQARIIHEQMELGAKTDFETVKSSLEGLYACLQVQCKDVGGVWDSQKGAYKANPCEVEDSLAASSSEKPQAALVATLLGLVSSCFLLLAA